jgi:diguanylate cyclase (GGDEF)-like protein/PAS domain S-box-containing protein
MYLNQYSLIVIFCAIVMLYCAINAWQYRSNPGARVFAGMMACVTLYTLGYSMELASLDLPTMLFWTKIEYLGIVLIAPLWFIFCLQYTGREKKLGRKWMALLFVIPAFTLFFRFTDQHLKFAYSSAFVSLAGPIPLLEFTRGPWYWVHTVFVFALILYSSYILAIKMRFSPDLYRSQAVALLAASMIPFVVLVIYALQIFPVKNFDLNPFGFTLLGLVVTWGMSRTRLFDLTPVAREALIENLEDGVVVLDIQGRIVDANPAARGIFNWSQLPLGQNASQVFQEWPDLSACCLQESLKSARSTVHTGFNARIYEVLLTELSDRRGRDIGRMMHAHDITAQKTTEQELQLANDAAEAANLELKKAAAELEHFAATDKLTGAYNRRKFEEIIAAEMHRAAATSVPLSLLMFDIDRFKLVNDQFGHHTGDELLVEVVKIVAANIRKSDSIVRWGGDEFLILAPGADIKNGVELSEKLRITVVSHRFPGTGILSISIGVTQFQSWDTSDTLVKRVDDALYQAKKNGRNRIEIGKAGPSPVI